MPSQASPTHQQPPNGGVAAWTKTLGCFMIYVNTWGIATSFGVYQSYYQQFTLHQYTPSTISWIGTTQVFLLFFVAIIGGPVYDRGNSQWLLYLGYTLIVFGYFMLSLATKFYQIFLSQSICVGIGSGLVFVPAVSTVAQAFSTKQPIALGLASTGSAIGGTIFPIMFRQLTPDIGLIWTNRVFGFLLLATSMMAAALLRSSGSSATEHEQHSLKKFFDISAFREPAFTCLCLGLFLVELGFWIPPFTISPYAQFTLGVGSEYAFYLIAIMNAGSFAGRILPAFVAQTRAIGPAWTLVMGSLGLGVLVLCWLAINNVVGVTVWAVIVGFMSGIVVSIPNVVVARLSAFTQVGSRSGMLWTIVAFAALVGAPIAGVLVDSDTNSYKWGQVFSGLCICAGAAVLCVPALYISRKRSE
ncbi:hypothetical protein M409DRAFT_65553 [Zasmidium cellare ATCC 36951]|uniref:Major facilitator superfamily (MFS) profile domain-containing protein n=1 Tax=Zasmidium cellare ATCC 36951 TaxID=1080233 RepID=A0A6A6CR89_ZASCE|nr:uncharacterized protein M409DRAFT_65553 [Zasmidium cellare ATCC 36951]KAF2168688.1 hypothetical protein M409DRAFT_65553 [Zasmidium cellare ATCC 36951]